MWMCVHFLEDCPVVVSLCTFASFVRTCHLLRSSSPRFLFISFPLTCLRVCGYAFVLWITYYHLSVCLVLPVQSDFLFCLYLKRRNLQENYK